jgi:hypothetical protein
MSGVCKGGRNGPGAATAWAGSTGDVVPDDGSTGLLVPLGDGVGLGERRSPEDPAPASPYPQPDSASASTTAPAATSRPRAAPTRMQAG